MHSMYSAFMGVIEGGFVLAEHSEADQAIFTFSFQGSVANKFYVHNDIFRYQDEVFGDLDAEPPEGNYYFFNCAELSHSSEYVPPYSQK